MASSCLTEEELLCAICLDVFTNPVTTSCGHNFCMTCLKEFWDSSSHYHCPVCKTECPSRPVLHVNTFISELAAQFKKSVQVHSSSTAKQLPSKAKKVLCDSCTGERLEALKSCLDCEVSYCNTHLIPHQTAAKLKMHKLIDPVQNLEDYICQKHERPLEMFCRDDQTCICQFCFETDHRNHKTVLMEEESQKKKTKLGETQSEVQQMIWDRLRHIENLKQSVQLNKTHTEKEKAHTMKMFRALINCIERNQAELLKMMEEKQKTAERQAEEFIKELEQEITELTRRNTELEQISHTEDHLHLLQVYPSLCSPPPTKNWTDIKLEQRASVLTVRRALIQLQKSLSSEMEKLPEIEINMVQQYAVNVTLDPDTAHPKLTLSDDGKQVRLVDKEKKLPEIPARMKSCLGVLGKEGFSSGRFYYEVQVRGKTGWDLGLAKESISRKSESTLSSKKGFWILSLRNKNEYKVCDSSTNIPSPKQAVQKVGVFVDYEGGLVAFYDVEAGSYLYTFTGQSFTEKLYPYLSPHLNNGGKNSAPLIVTPIKQSK